MNDIIWVQMTITISGGRADGRNWPDRWGDPIDIPAEEAWPLIRSGNAIQVDAPEPPRAQPPPASMTPAPRSEPAGTARGPVWAQEPDAPVLPERETIQERFQSLREPELMRPAEELMPDPELMPAVPSLADMDPPKAYDPKQSWIDYAMAHGETEDEANMQTKAGLMQKYGGRL